MLIVQDNGLIIKSGRVGQLLGFPCQIMVWAFHHYKSKSYQGKMIIHTACREVLRVHSGTVAPRVCCVLRRPSTPTGCMFREAAFQSTRYSFAGSGPAKIKEFTHDHVI